MSRKRYDMNEAKIARFVAEGRGQGTGAAYLPWLTVRDVPSTGRSHRCLGRVAGRVHHLLSDLELHACLIYDWGDATEDIREQYPLDRDDTRRAAKGLGVRHPADHNTKVDAVMTTDLVVDLRRGGRKVTIARAVKPADQIKDKRVLEKLLIERDCWAARGVDWGVVTERELPPTLVANLLWLQGGRRAEAVASCGVDARPDVVAAMAREAAEQPNVSLGQICARQDERFALERGECLRLARHLLATKAWTTDMALKIDANTPMRRFAFLEAPAARALA